MVNVEKFMFYCDLEKNIENTIKEPGRCEKAFYQKKIDHNGFLTSRSKF
jgi:hypothetical protein